MDAQAAGKELPVLVHLRSGQHQDVLVTRVRVHRDFAAGTEMQESCRGPRHAIAVEMMDFHSRLEGLPWNPRLPFGGVEEIASLQRMR